MNDHNDLMLGLDVDVDVAVAKKRYEGDARQSHEEKRRIFAKRASNLLLTPYPHRPHHLNHAHPPSCINHQLNPEN